MTDDEIIERYWQRDEIAIRETEVRYGSMLFRIAYNILHDASDSEECKNDTYLGIWNTIPPTRPTIFSAFIAQIMRNIAIKRYREKTSQKRIPSELSISMDELQAVLCGETTPETEYAERELGKLISDYIRTLSERQQYLFIGRFYMSETISYLADKLGIGVATVHRELGKIRQGLRAYLVRNGVDI